MRRKCSLLLVLVLSILAVVVPQGCASEDPIQIAYILRTNSVFWNNVEAGMQDAAEAADVELLPFYTAGQDNVIDFSTAVDVATLVGANAIITSYKEDEEYLNSLLRAQGSGCTIIFMDTDGPEILRDCYVGVDHVEVGRVLAETMLETLNPGEHALLSLFDIAVAGVHHMMVAQGVIEVFEQSECVLDVFYEDKNLDVERQVELDNYIQTHPEVHGIITLSQLQTRGYARLLASAEWKDRVRIVGLDYQEVVLPYIQDGSIYAILDKNGYEMGVACIETAMEILNGWAIPGERVEIDFIILNSENIQEYLTRELNK